jgi:hypothetical protein
MKLQFHISFLYILQKLFPHNVTTLAAGLFSVEYFPMVIDLIQKKSEIILDTRGIIDAPNCYKL